MTSNKWPAQRQFVANAARKAGFQVNDDASPIMAAEDFSVFINKWPGCFFFLGCRFPGKDSFSHHNANFKISEEPFGGAVQTWVNVATNRLQSETPPHRLGV